MKAAWYISHALAATVVDEEGAIVALLAARPVDRPGIGVIPYYFNKGGGCMHIDIWLDVSEDDRARMVLCSWCRMRFPQCTTIAMFRHFEEKLRVYSLSRFWRSLEKIKYVPRKKKEKLYAQT